ncbi:MAG: hypothetical protein WBA93_19775 [Microcoleaceae cyanobacterium]
MVFLPVLIPQSQTADDVEVTEIEFTSDKPDEYFGRCSSSSNYTLPEEQQLFSNSGYSIDEKGLYLSPANTQDRLILWDYQYTFEQLKKVTWYFYNDTNSSIYVNLFSQILNQLQLAFRHSYFLSFADFRDAGGTNSHNTFSMTNSFFSPYQYNIWGLDFENRMSRRYNSNVDYSLQTLVVEHEVSFNYKGILFLGWHGVANNQNHRLRKIVVEKYK